MALNQKNGDDIIKREKVLIFIPCHTDFLMAFNTTKEIISQIDDLKERKIEVHVHISVNGVGNLKNPFNESIVTLSATETIIGADTNITLGYIKALQVCPDYLWILSANEELTDNSIRNLSNLITCAPKADLFVANAAGREGELQISNVFTEVPEKTALGLISGVIYRFSALKESFPQASIFSWTGWGQLSVIQHYLSNSSQRKILEFPDFQLYKKPFTYMLIPKDITEMEIVGNVYGHSFFGLPILAFCTLQNQKKTLRKFQRQWVKQNWYKTNLFLQEVTFGDELRLKRNRWIFEIAKETFGIFSIQGLILRFSYKLPTAKLRNHPKAKTILSWYKEVTR